MAFRTPVHLLVRASAINQFNAERNLSSNNPLTSHGYFRMGSSCYGRTQLCGCSTLHTRKRYPRSEREGHLGYRRWVRLFTDNALMLHLTLYNPTGNAGLGRETVLQLAKHNPKKIFLAARSEVKAEEAISAVKSSVSNDVQISWIPLDLMSAQSIKNAAEQVSAQSSRLDVLILNAGVMALPPGETEMGHEIQFGTNHTGHSYLTRLLLPTLLKTAEEPNSDVRVVSLASVGYNFAPTFEKILNQEKLKKVSTIFMRS